MATEGLGPPGASVYWSDTIHVGDGTWDASRDSFLLPNIQGLNYETMRYNGMGNRFRGQPEYYSLILGHGVIAAITFVGLVPAAIFIARFYHRNPRLALRAHVSIQILTVIMATVVLILGYFAVGPRRSLSNPHHGIGVAIYVLVLFQSIGGWAIHRMERRKKIPQHIPIKLMLHKWLGTATALLALAQIPIGLTLYGSPIYLFVLYALVMLGYLVLHFVLSYWQYSLEAITAFGSETYYTETSSTTRPHRSFGPMVAAVVGAVGLTALAKRFQGRSERDLQPNSNLQSDSHDYAMSQAGTEQSRHGRRFWRDTRPQEAQNSLYDDNATSTNNVNRMEEGLPSGIRWQTQDGHPNHVSDISVLSSSESAGKRSRIAGIGAFLGVIGLGGWLERRRLRRDQERIEIQRIHEQEDEKILRAHEQLLPVSSAPGAHFQDHPTLPLPPLPPQAFQSRPVEPVMQPWGPVIPIQATVPPPPMHHNATHPITGSNNPMPDLASQQDVYQNPAHVNNNSNVPEHMQSPAVSLKLRAHQDGRRVTLRRLNATEAAIEREHRRLGRQERSSDRYPAQETAIADVATTNPSEGSPFQRADLSPPSGTETYDINRRRRRAERAASEQSHGQHVQFQ